MNQLTSNAAQNIAEAVTAYQKQSTGHAPQRVTVVLCEDTLVVTLPEALTPGEKAMARSADGADQVQEFHRQLFATSSQSLRQEIQRITGRQVREAAAEIKPTDGAILHAFTNGTMVQVFLLAPTPVEVESHRVADQAKPQIRSYVMANAGGAEIPTIPRRE